MRVSEEEPPRNGRSDQSGCRVVGAVAEPRVRQTSWSGSAGRSRHAAGRMAPPPTILARAVNSREREQPRGHGRSVLAQRGGPAVHERQELPVPWRPERARRGTTRARHGISASTISAHTDLDHRDRVVPREVSACFEALVPSSAVAVRSYIALSGPAPCLASKRIIAAALWSTSRTRSCTPSAYKQCRTRSSDLHLHECWTPRRPYGQEQRERFSARSAPPRLEKRSVSPAAPISA
jgi:hypothetical protein